MASLPFTIDERRAMLHVFSEGGSWHWGISVPRDQGGGFKVIAYNAEPFAKEGDAVENGTFELTKLIDATPAAVECASARHECSGMGKTEYMRERLRCAMARLVRCQGEQAVQAERWAIAWGALIGEQHFDGLLNRRSTTVCLA